MFQLDSKSRHTNNSFDLITYFSEMGILLQDETTNHFRCIILMSMSENYSIWMSDFCFANINYENIVMNAGIFMRFEIIFYHLYTIIKRICNKIYNDMR